MIIYFTKIEFAGETCILVTQSDAKPLAILSKLDIQKLNKEWNKE